MAAVVKRCDFELWLGFVLTRFEWPNPETRPGQVGLASPTVLTMGDVFPNMPVL
jgi:hypothetical protein